ncbi:MAG: leucine-rich repeat protein [Solobacterium sp.]|nr:leucine-rich repeat protein [Solobacterium sp.]
MKHILKTILYIACLTSVLTPVQGKAETLPEETVQAPVGYLDEEPARASRRAVQNDSDFTYEETDDDSLVITGYSGSETELAIPKTIDGKTVTAIGYRAFASSGIVSVTMPDTIQTIYDDAFAFCRSLKKVKLSASLTYLGGGALAETKIENLQLPDSLESIGDYALQGLHIKTFTLPLSMKDYSPLAVVDTNAAYRLETIIVPEGNAYYSAKDGILYSKDGKTLVNYPSGRKGSSYAIEKGITKIGRCAFANNEYLQAITIANTVTTMDEAPFVNTRITDLHVPASVTEYAYFPFSNMYELVNVVMEDSGIEELPYQCFRGDAKLKSIILPASLVRLGAHALRDTGLEILDLSMMKNLKETSGGSCCENKQLKKVILPEGIQLICEDSFSFCPNLQEINLPDSLNEIEGNAFRSSPVNDTFRAPKGMFCVDENTKHYIRNIETLVVSGEMKYDDAYKVLDLVNKERSAAGAPALTMDQELLDAAMQRAVETSVYWDHTRPDNTKCFTICSKMFGENIAAGQSNPESVMKSWMNSSGHRSNILNTGFTLVGIGAAVVDGSIYWVQCFGSGSLVPASKEADSRKTYRFYADRDLAEAECETEISMEKGETHTIHTYVNRTDIEPETFTYTASNDNVKVSDKGVITAVKDGESVITAVNITDTTLRYEIHVRVETKITAISIQDAKTEMQVNETQTLKVVITPSDASAEVRYSSSDPSVAKIDDKGLITALKEGTVKITAEAGGRKTSFTLTVKDSSSDPAACRAFGFCRYNGKWYWYEDWTRQGTMADPRNVIGDGTPRGREIYDSESNGWYWLDSIYDGAKAEGKEVWVPYIYQDDSGKSDAQLRELARLSDAGLEDYMYSCLKNRTGKWIRYDENGKMIKGWVTIAGELARIYPGQAGNTYYYDTMTGVMAKGWITMNGQTYHFDEVTGALIS